MKRLAPLLGILIAIGCGALVVGVPALVLWGTSQITNSVAEHFGLSFVLMPIAIVVMAMPLAWLNGAYVRLTTSGGRTQSGPLDSLIVVAGIAAVVFIFLWLVVPLGDPPLNPFPFG